MRHNALPGLGQATTIQILRFNFSVIIISHTVLEILGRMHFILFNWATNKYQWFCQVNILYKRLWKDKVFFSVDLAAVHAVNNLPVLQTRKILLIGYLVSWGRRIAFHVWIILIVRSIPGQIIHRIIDAV